MAYNTALEPAVHNRIEHFTDEDLCLIHELRIPLEQGSHPNTRRIPDTAEYRKLYLLTKTAILKTLLYKNPYTPDHGRKFLWPEEHLNTLSQRARTLGYSIVTRGVVTKYFSFGPDDYTTNEPLPLLINPLGDEATAKLVPIKCALLSFVKASEDNPHGFVADSALKQLDILGVAGSMALVEEVMVKVKGVISATLAATTADNGNRKTTVNKGAQLALAARQYNMWCNILYAEEPLTIRVLEGKVVVTRVSEHRPLPQWAVYTWGAARAKIAKYIMEVSIKTGKALLSPKQAMTLRNTMYLKGMAQDYKVSVNKQRAHMSVSGEAIKIRANHPDNEPYLEQILYISVTPK